jgi:hypothetical protein
MLCPIAAVLCGRGAQSHQWFQWPLPFSAFGPARDCERSGAERDWDDDCCDDKAAEREAQCRRAHTVSALIPLRLRGVAPVRSRPAGAFARTVLRWETRRKQRRRPRGLLRACTLARRGKDRDIA